MENFLSFGFLLGLVYLLIQFARQEHLQDDYEETILDIEGRLEWAQTRSSFPFGMKAQIEVSRQRMNRAKRLWKRNKWQHAYHTALRAQEAMGKAQSIYSLSIKKT